jgi:phosphate transport system substrate-binding protein
LIAGVHVMHIAVKRDGTRCDSNAMIFRRGVNGMRMVAVGALFAAALSSTACSRGEENAIKLKGAGASLPAPLYRKWFKAYNRAHPNIEVDYKSVGSGGGVKSFMERTVDFAASDAAMKPEDMAKIKGGVQLLPMTGGAIALAYNLRDIPNLRLSRDAYIGIFNGTVTRWNDPLIAKANPGVKLPDQSIYVIVRADASGTTYVFTKHLSAISPQFEKAVGVDTLPNWQHVGIRVPGTEGMTESIMTTPGAIGYVEYSYAYSEGVPAAALENKAGNYVAPAVESAEAALKSAEVPPDMIVWVSDPAATDAYPIVTYSWMILYKRYDDKEKLDALKGLIDYGLTDGQKDSESLGYVPLPAAVAAKAKAAVDAL